MVQLNDRWYRWIDGFEGSVIEEIRVIRIQNKEVCTVKFVKGERSDTKKLEQKYIQENYTKLTPDGYLTFSVVPTGKVTTDIMVTISTRSDIKKGEVLPYAVCRQGAIDLFAKQLSKTNNDIVGISVSRDTCPADVDFSEFFACDGVIYSETMSYYIGDKLSDCLNIIKKKDKFTETLTDNFEKHCMYIANNNKFIANTYKVRTEVDGYCKTLEDLLMLNNFEYDVNSAFGIISTDLTKDDFSEETLSALAMEVIGSLLRVEIDRSLAIPYDKDIDLSKIKRKYCLVSDKDNNIYVVAYTISGKYVVPIEDQESEQNIDKLSKVLSAESLQLAYQHMKFNSSKYKEN